MEDTVLSPILREGPYADLELKGRSPSAQVEKCLEPTAVRDLGSRHAFLLNCLHWEDKLGQNLVTSTLPPPSRQKAKEPLPIMWTLLLISSLGYLARGSLRSPWHDLQPNLKRTKISWADRQASFSLFCFLLFLSLFLPLAA